MKIYTPEKYFFKLKFHRESAACDRNCCSPDRFLIHFLIGTEETLQRWLVGQGSFRQAPHAGWWKAGVYQHTGHVTPNRTPDSDQEARSTFVSPFVCFWRRSSISTPSQRLRSLSWTYWAIGRANDETPTSGKAISVKAVNRMHWNRLAMTRLQYIITTNTTTTGFRAAQLPDALSSDRKSEQTWCLEKSH